MNNFFQEIKNLTDVKDLKLIDKTGEEYIYTFIYNEVEMFAIQSIVQTNYLSRLSFSISSDGLLNRLSKEIILEEVNNFNTNILTLKSCVLKFHEKNVVFRFTIEYSVDDKLFKDIDLNKALFLLFFAPDILFKNLKEKEVTKNEK